MAKKSDFTAPSMIKYIVESFTLRSAGEITSLYNQRCRLARTFEEWLFVPCAEVAVEMTAGSLENWSSLALYDEACTFFS